MMLNCNSIANNGFNAPFFQQLSPQNFQVKNCLEDQFVMGDPRAPTPSGGINVINNKVKRDIFSIPITNLTNTSVPYHHHISSIMAWSRGMSAPYRREQFPRQHPE
jgi:hypothetical protein